MARDYIKHQIDGERLKKAIELTGLTMAEASMKIGRNGDYLRACAAQGIINSATEKAIEAILGIPLGMYIVTKPTTEAPEQGRLEGLETPEEPATAWMTYDELNRCIFNAVYGALKKASYEQII